MEHVKNRNNGFVMKKKTLNWTCRSHIWTCLKQIHIRKLNCLWAIFCMCTSYEMVTDINLGVLGLSCVLLSRIMSILYPDKLTGFYSMGKSLLSKQHIFIQDESKKCSWCRQELPGCPSTAATPSPRLSLKLCGYCFPLQVMRVTTSLLPVFLPPSQQKVQLSLR